MRRLTAVAAVLLAVGSGCGAGAQSDGAIDSPQEAGQQAEPLPSPTAFESVNEPFELDLKAPSGFSADDADRDVLVADDHLTYDFGLDDGHKNSHITVTTYLLPKGTDTSGYDAQVGVILEYDERRGNTLSEGKHVPTLVHGYAGVYRLAKYKVHGEEVTQQNHYLFAGRHLIQITCQWEFDFDEVYAACQDLTTAFPYPREWPLPYRADP